MSDSPLKTEIPVASKAFCNLSSPEFISRVPWQSWTQVVHSGEVCLKSHGKKTHLSSQRDPFASLPALFTCPLFYQCFLGSPERCVLHWVHPEVAPDRRFWVKEFIWEIGRWPKAWGMEPQYLAFDGAKDGKECFICSWIKTLKQELSCEDFPGGPVVENTPSNARDIGSTPDSTCCK